MSDTFIDRESIYEKLNLLGTVAGLMADHPENFGKIDRYAMQSMLYDIAKEVYPERAQERASAAGFFLPSPAENGVALACVKR